MPSNKILEEKKQKVAAIAEKLKAASSIVLVDYKGINVADDTKLRAELREAGVSYSVEKNSLLSFACKAAGFEEFVPHLAGTTAIAIGSDDALAPARVLNKYSEKGKDKFNVKIGYVDGRIVGVEEVKALALLPDRNTLIAMVCGALNGTISGLARALNEVAQKQSA